MITYFVCPYDFACICVKIILLLPYVYYSVVAEWAEVTETIYEHFCADPDYRGKNSYDLLVCTSEAHRAWK